MVYTYTYYSQTELNMDRLAAYDLWIADYRSKRPTRKHGMWQYTSTGRLDGIAGSVDISHAYKDYPTIIARAGLTQLRGVMPVEQIILSALPGILSGMVVAVVSAVVGASVGYAIGHFRREGKKSKALENGVKGLLRAKILDLGLHYIDEGAIPPYGLETLRSCYDPYMALGDGDPSVTHVVHKCESLPVRTGSEE